MAWTLGDRDALTPRQRQMLWIAKWLVRRVVSEHPHDVSGHVAVHMLAAIHDIDLVEKDLNQ